MRRAKRYCPTGIPVHIIQRGNNRTNCFESNGDRATYIGILRDAAVRYRVDIHAWVLMTNHVHLLVTPRTDNGVSSMMQYVGARYVRYFNKRYSRSGTLWEGRFKSCLIQTEDYFFTCQRYIELNPVRAGMVQHPADYRWSSYNVNTSPIESNLISPHSLYIELASTDQERQQAYRRLFADLIDSVSIESIRTATNKGLVLGYDDFKDIVEKQSGQRTRLLRPGPKPTPDRRK